MLVATMWQRNGGPAGHRSGAVYTRADAMARTEKEIDDLARRIEALPRERRAKLLERVLWPEIELHRAAEAARKYVRVDDPVLERAVNRATRRIRRERLGR